MNCRPSNRSATTEIISRSRPVHDEINDSSAKSAVVEQHQHASSTSALETKTKSDTKEQVSGTSQTTRRCSVLWPSDERYIEATDQKPSVKPIKTLEPGGERQVGRGRYRFRIRYESSNNEKTGNETLVRPFVPSRVRVSKIDRSVWNILCSANEPNKAFGGCCSVGGQIIERRRRRRRK